MLVTLSVSVDVCVVVGDVNIHVFTKCKLFTRCVIARFSSFAVVLQLSSRIRSPIMHLGLLYDVLLKPTNWTSVLMEAIASLQGFMPDSTKSLPSPVGSAHLRRSRLAPHNLNMLLR